MLTMGIWVIVFILVIVHWEKIAPAITGIIGFSLSGILLLIGLTILAFGVYWAVHGMNWVAHNQEQFGGVSLGLALMAFIFAGLLSIPHVIWQGYKSGWAGFYRIVAPKGWERIALLLILAVYVAYYWNLVYRYEHVTAVDTKRDISTDAFIGTLFGLLALALYLHRRLCQTNLPDCWITRPFPKRSSLNTS